MRKALFLTALALLGCGSGLTDQGPSVKQAPALSAHRVLSAEELFKKISPSVFVVLALDASKHPIEQGSAVVVGKELLETNYHVVRNGTTFRVRQGTKSWPAKLVATNPDRDIAELNVEGLNAPAVPLRRFDSLVVGEKVYAIGAPEGLELTLSEGLVSSLRQSGHDHVIQTTAAISPGSSGGGLFDATGQLVGITVAYLKQGQNLNFALPTDSLSSAHSASAWLELGARALTAGHDYVATADEKNKELLATNELDRGKAIAGKAIAATDAAQEAFREAVSDYRQSLRLNSADEEAWRALGDAIVLEWEDGPISPQQAQVWQQTSKTLQREAMRAYQKAVRLKPEDEKAWKGLGNSEVGQDDAAAQKAYQKAVQIDPRDAEVWEDLGMIYAGGRRFDDGLTAFDTARALIGPADEKAWDKLGMLYLEIGKSNAPRDAREPYLERALKCQQHAIKLRPKDADAWSDLGYVYLAMGDRAGAVGVYEKLKTLDPEAASAFFNGYLSPNR